MPKTNEASLRFCNTKSPVLQNMIDRYSSWQEIFNEMLCDGKITIHVAATKRDSIKELSVETYVDI